MAERTYQNSARVRGRKEAMRTPNASQNVCSSRKSRAPVYSCCIRCCTQAEEEEEEEGERSYVHNTILIFS